MMNRGTLANFLTCSDLGVPARKTGKSRAGFDKAKSHHSCNETHYFKKWRQGSQ